MTYVDDLIGSLKSAMNESAQDKPSAQTIAVSDGDKDLAHEIRVEMDILSRLREHDFVGIKL